MSLEEIRDSRLTKTHKRCLYYREEILRKVRIHEDLVGMAWRDGPLRDYAVAFDNALAVGELVSLRVIYSQVCKAVDEILIDEDIKDVT